MANEPHVLHDGSPRRRARSSTSPPSSANRTPRERPERADEPARAAKDRALTAAGRRVIRITWRQLTHDPDTIARQLATLLSH
jgi:hypothetical protein